MPPTAKKTSEPVCNERIKDPLQTTEVEEEVLDFSIVVPFHNEESSLLGVLSECLDTLDQLPALRSEIVAVNDGSEDSCGAILTSLAVREPRLRVITFLRNRGQAAALYTGLHAARGQIVGTLDGDGQNNPADFPVLLRQLEESGVDMVTGVRIKRRDSRMRRWMSRIANHIRGAFLNDGVSDSGCAIKVFRRSVVDSLIPLQTLYSFIPALARAGGHTIVECPVDHRERHGGETHYGLGVFLWRPLVDMMGVWWFTKRRFEIEP